MRCGQHAALVGDAVEMDGARRGVCHCVVVAAFLRGLDRLDGLLTMNKTRRQSNRPYENKNKLTCASVP